MPSAAAPVVAILAGGLASRMRPATLTLAKSMLPVAGMPFLAHQLRLLAGQGIREVVICCGHLEEQLRAYAGDGSLWGCRIRYSPDGEAPLGTGGALLQALPLLPSHFLVMYGDSYLPTDLLSVWQEFEESGKPGLMTVFRNEGRWDASNVEYLEGVIHRYSKLERDNKMCHIDYGLSGLSAEAFGGRRAGERFDLAELLQQLLQAGELAGYEVRERFYEIGSPAGLLELGALLGAQNAAPGGNQ